MPRLHQFIELSSYTDTFESQAGGRFGSWLANELVKTGKHTVTAITRIDSVTEMPEGVTAAKVDYNDEVSVINALKDQQILIITLSVMASQDSQYVPLLPSRGPPRLGLWPLKNTLWSPQAH